MLIEAGIERTDAFAAVSPSDNANIIAARIARNVFKVPRVVARLYDPRRAEIYRRLGLLTISSTTASVMAAWEMSGACWVEITTVSTCTGRPFT